MSREKKDVKIRLDNAIERHKSIKYNSANRSVAAVVIKSIKNIIKSNSNDLICSLENIINDLKKTTPQEMFRRLNKIQQLKFANVQVRYVHDEKSTNYDGDDSEVNWMRVRSYWEDELRNPKGYLSTCEKF